MKKIILLALSFVALNFIVTSGGNTVKHSKNTQNDVKQGSFSQFLTSPKTAPVIVPLPKKLKPAVNSGQQSNSQQNKTDNQNSAPSPSPTPQPDPSAAMTPPAQAPLQGTTTCSPDPTTGACTTPDATGTTTTPDSAQPNCNLSDPNAPIQQYEQNGRITCQ